MRHVFLLYIVSVSLILVTAARDDEFPARNSSHGTRTELNRWKRQAKISVNVCLKEQWKCRDGSCISIDSICDGVVDCRDSSDETHALCRKMRCPPHLFRCTYGACVNGAAACNGKVECADASDELIPQCVDEISEENGQYKCRNGDSIPAVSRCDGEADCADGSDETVESCGAMVCHPYLFQCAYGACVSKGADCNGKIDCADGSDEAVELCGGTSTDVTVTSPKPTDNSGGSACILPKYPKHGTYRVLGARGAFPGEAYSSPILDIRCEPGYVLNATSNVYCVDGVWFGDMPNCTRQCKLAPNPSVSYTCMIIEHNTRSSWPCKEFEADGTIAVPECQENYHYTGIAPNAKCVNGRWENLISCNPECGTVVPKSNQLMIGGRVAERGELSWHAGIYQKSRSFEQICGGSLVRKQVIISAAHCFWNSNEETKMPPTDYAVAAGKIYRSWNDKRENDEQKRVVSDIKIPKRFRGPETNYQDDIALVFVETPFEYTQYIRPVCVDFDEAFNSEQLRPGQKGKVAGWGLTDPQGLPSEVLRVVELPVVDIGICLDRSPPDFKAHITSDKICAGYYSGTALCKGDSGGGLSFPDLDRGKLRYYLRGIVSTAPRNEELCNSQTITAFTRIMSHKVFINNNVKEAV